MGPIFQKNQIINKNILLSTAYFPPIAYFSCLALAKTIAIETQESFIKQSFRSRCEILSANGKIQLNIPIKHDKSGAQKITETQIDFSSKWQNEHIRTLETVYNQSPYFEFYFPEYKSIIKNAPESLFELNILIKKQLSKDLDVIFNPVFTISYEKTIGNNLDLRNLLQPKVQTTFDFLKPYHQVFNDKLGFQEDLSILDLLFNSGPDAWLHFE